MEPTEAVNLVERELRLMVTELLPDWHTRKPIDVADLERKRDQDKRKRRGSVVDDKLINYTEFHHLKQLIADNWNAFTPALGKQKYLVAYLDRLEGFRNPAMHGRDLLPFEEHLVQGIVGEFRNLISIYRSIKGPDMNYYPTIEDVTDSFGRVRTGYSDSTPQQFMRVQVGDRVTFRCRGHDPQGRTLRWEFALHMGWLGTWEYEGEDVTLTWTVEDSRVIQEAVVYVRMRSDGAYHRMLGYDESVTFFYSIDPPH